VSPGNPVPLPSLAARIPPAPSPQLNAYLDAAAECFARHGIRRSSVQDVARRLGVNRTTVYRQVGNVDDMVRLLLARELHRFLEQVPVDIRPERGPAAVVALLAAVVHHARTHPVLVKVLRDEPEIIGPFLVAELPALINRVATEIVPLLRWAMEQGSLADRDPARLADWLVRTAVTLILAPPDDDVEEFLSDLLLPTLVPVERSGPRARRRTGVARGARQRG
jgi:AcrR family transcriptional regulator